MRDHDSKKTFWQKALLFISKDAAMTKADVQYLEHKAIAAAKSSCTFVLNENKQTPKAPNLPEYRKDDMDEFFEDVKFSHLSLVVTFLTLPNQRMNIFLYKRAWV